MWREIRLEAVGVIEEATLEFCPGLTVITGETGAGKTMVVTALGLLRGARADPGLVRHGARTSRVEGRVTIAEVPAAAALAEEAGAALDVDDTLILGRTVGRDGRSRAVVGGASVPAGTLAAVSDLLVTIHGQADQHRLLRPTAQRAALDRYAGDALRVLLDDYRPGFGRLKEIEAAIEVMTGAEQERLREVDRLAFGLAEIAAVAPVPGEDDELRAEAERLAHADALRAAASAAHGFLIGGDGESLDAHGLIVAAHAMLQAQGGHDDRVADLAARVDEVRVLAADVAADLAGYASGMEVDPVRLDWVQERRAALGTLLRKYGPTVDDVLSWAKESAARRSDLEASDERVEALRVERADLLDRLLALAADISRHRSEAAGRLAERVSAELTALAMPHARLEAVVRAVSGPDPASRLGPDGWDDVGLRLSANPGSLARPLARGASGGELSRVMLALEVVLADTASTPTMIFDEVDAGIGGKAAVEVGRRLARLARTAQVVAVTHLPQVAAFAERHYRVVKSDDGTVTTSGVHVVDAETRVQELSRMLAGIEGSTTAEAHARELLRVAASDVAAQGTAAGPQV